MTKKKTTRVEPEKLAGVVAKKLAAELKDFIDKTGLVIGKIDLTTTGAMMDNGKVEITQGIQIHFGKAELKQSPPDLGPGPSIQIERK